MSMNTADDFHRIPDRPWRTTVVALWSSIRWLLLAGSALAVFLLGWIGFRNYFNAIGVERSGSDLAYLSLQLFTLESGSVPESGAPWTLEVARLAAPLVSATAVVTALAAAFQQQLKEWQLRRARDHIVVCGLGASGERLARELLAAGHHVVGIDADGQNPALNGLRQRGAESVIGDARDVETLRRARLDRATHLLCLTGADDTNAEIALSASELVATRQGPALTCLVNIADSDLCLLLRSAELAAPHRGGARLDFFNIEEQGARALLHDHSPFPVDEAGSPPRVLLVGSSRLGQTLIAELARQWRAHPAADGRRIEITVVDPSAVDMLRRLHGRYPQLAHASQLTPVVAELDPFDPTSVSGCTPDIVYVCMAQDSSSLQVALRIGHAIADPACPVVVELVHSPGMAQVIDRPGFSANIRPFNVLDRAMRSDLLLGGTYEILARAIHREYVESQRRAGASPATNPSMVPWEDLPTSLQESNRDQAAHIGEKLAALGHGIAPLTDWDADKEFAFTPAQVEMLSELEHERWVEQRRRDGWTAGPKDVAGKRTPYLGSWESLTEEVKEWDRQAVRAIPAFLARAGYQIVSGPTQGRA